MKKIDIKTYFKQEKEKLRQPTSIVPSLLIIDATDGDVGNQIYIRKKVEDFKSLNWDVTVLQPRDQEEYEDLVHDTYDPRFSASYTSVIVQLPVSKRFTFKNTDIHPLCDCDGLNPFSPVMPATVRGIIDYLDACGFEYEGKSAVVLGRSDIVGKPMAKALLDRDMTVTVCHSKSSKQDRDSIMMEADLIVSAVGKPHLFSRKDCIPAIVIDVGINRNEDGKLCGDFDEDPEWLGGCFENWSTPVPGGVGLLTRLGLLKNCKELAEKQFPHTIFGG